MNDISIIDDNDLNTKPKKILKKWDIKILQI
jgi:hypothetical protein